MNAASASPAGAVPVGDSATGAAGGPAARSVDARAAAPAGPLAVRLDRGGALLRLKLSRPKANLIDAAMIAALSQALVAHRDSAGLRAVLLEADGPHFSFGASVEEHLAERCAAMLGSLHALIMAMLEFPVPILVAVRGQCLGGGLEVALAGSRIFCTAEAQLGQPEIRLGVFAPAASCLLPYRLAQPVAEDLLLTGRSVSGEEARAIGLVQALAAEPEAAALDYFDRHLADKSAAALACAVRAARGHCIEGVRARLAEVERDYLDVLMKTHDANEGLAAFIARRPPQWEHR